MLDISPLQTTDLSNKTIYLQELQNRGNLWYIHLKLEYVHRLGKLQSSLNIFRDCSVFNFSLSSIWFMLRPKILTEWLPVASKATHILI